MTQETTPRKLDVIFATSPDGRVFEIPSAQADKFALTPERIKELGHLPILPYNMLLEPAPKHPHGEHESEGVEGRHFVPWAGGWHFQALVGPFIGPDGCAYYGLHYHPYGTILGLFA